MLWIEKRTKWRRQRNGDFLLFLEEVRVERFNSNRGDFIVWMMEEVKLHGYVETAETNLIEVQQHRVNPLMSRAVTVSVN